MLTKGDLFIQGSLLIPLKNKVSTLDCIEEQDIHLTTQLGVMAYTCNLALRRGGSGVQGQPHTLEQGQLGLYKTLCKNTPNRKTKTCLYQNSLHRHTFFFFLD